MAGPKTWTLVCNEYRSATVHAAFLEAFSPFFSMKKARRASQPGRAT
jgi:hypothetical protein